MIFHKWHLVGYCKKDCIFFFFFFDTKKNFYFIFHVTEPFLSCKDFLWNHIFLLFLLWRMKILKNSVFLASISHFSLTLPQRPFMAFISASIFHSFFKFCFQFRTFMKNKCSPYQYVLLTQKILAWKNKRMDQRISEYLNLLCLCLRIDGIR